ncbi:MAG TPA: hypothetical protein VHA74_03625 [Candidatus Dojkabacteria bacterium]|nr:hypothetical protein [Candidatus Dojkabacteria bacterium]
MPGINDEQSFENIHAKYREELLRFANILHYNTYSELDPDFAPEILTSAYAFTILRSNVDDQMQLLSCDDYGNSFYIVVTSNIAVTQFDIYKPSHDEYMKILERLRNEMECPRCNGLIQNQGILAKQLNQLRPYERRVVLKSLEDLFKSDGFSQQTCSRGLQIKILMDSLINEFI